MRTALQKNEKILLVTRTSWVILIVPALVVAASIALAFFTYQYSHWFLLLPLAACGYFYWKYLEQQHNLWAVTNFRVIDEYGVVNINSKESPLDKINNVSYSQQIWGRILGYGDVEIQTAATIGGTVYQFVQNPRLLKDTITTAQANYKQAQAESQVRQPEANFVVQNRDSSSIFSAPPATTAATNHLASELEKLFELRQRGVLTEEEYQRAKSRLLA